MHVEFEDIVRKVAATAISVLSSRHRNVPILLEDGDGIQVIQSITHIDTAEFLSFYKIPKTEVNSFFFFEILLCKQTYTFKTYVKKKIFNLR